MEVPLEQPAVEPKKGKAPKAEKVPKKQSKESEEDDDEEDDDDLENLDKEVTDLSNPDVVTKYKLAGELATKVLSHVISLIVPKKKIFDICDEGDKLINQLVAPHYTKNKVLKGIAFPTCVSVNNCVGHNSPLPDSVAILEEGDVVKIDLGVHIDGFAALVAQTVVVAPPTIAITGRRADVISAAHYAAECALRLLKPGRTNTEVTEAILKVAEIYHVNACEGVLSHVLDKNVVDGDKVIINRPTPDQKVDEIHFEEGETYAIDIVMSTGEGKTRELENRTTVYKRAQEQSYQVRMKASHYVLNEIREHFGNFPFSLKALEDKRGRLGIVELVKHTLVHAYPILWEKSGEFVAQVKFTVLLLPSGTDRLTAANILPPNIVSEHKIEDAKIKAILATGTKRTSAAKKNKKKKKKESKAPPNLVAINPEKREEVEKKEAEKPKPMDTTK